MYVLGIGDHVNAGSALLKDGRIIAAVNDERLVREKMVFGVPRESIKKVLEIGGIGPADVDAVACGTVNQHLIDKYVDFRGGWFGLERSLPKAVLFSVGSHVSRFRRQLPFLESFYYMLRQPSFRRRRKALRAIFRDEFGFKCSVRFIDHHLAHATSSYYSSGYKDALVVSIDGGGDGVSAKAYDVSDGNFREVSKVSSFNSLGNYYAYITEICGFRAGKHEGKVTGLAAHGEPEYLDLLNELITFEDGAFVNVGNVFFGSALKTIRNRLPKNFSRDNLACSIQTHAQNLAVAYTQHWCRQTGKRNVALVGGLCANVRINQCIFEIPEVESVFVHPGMGDEGMGVGASLAVYHDPESGRQAPSGRCLDHVYLGPEYSDEEILEELKQAGFAYQECDDVETEVAQLLADGFVVARFNGRMEYGPRALGNRSILYAPNDPAVNDWLNEALQRTEFMPFAPATLFEDAEQCYVGIEGATDSARFMTITFDCTSWMSENCPGVVHIDNTARPQLVREQDNKSFYRIIKAYKAITGLPCVVNTSFNIHEEPIVCSPADALRAFDIGHLDYLAIGKYILKNPTGASDRARAVASRDMAGATNATAGEAQN